MAGIDKIYVGSYEEYAEIRDFFKAHEFTTKDGNRVKLRHYLLNDDTVGPEEERKEIREWYSDGDTHPVTNTPNYVDAWLLHNCPLESVQDYLHDVYKNPEEDLMEPELGEACTKVAVKKKGRLAANYPMSFHNMRGDKVRGYHIEVSCPDHYWWYNENRDKWYRSDQLEPWTCSAAYIRDRSVKSVVRKIIKKWRLPAGCEIRVSGKYVGEDWVFVTK